MCLKHGRMLSNTAMASFMGSGPGNQVIAVPAEFGNLLLNNEDDPSINDKMEISGALSQLSQDTDYSIKNAPLTTYVEHHKGNFPLWNYTSQQDTIVGKQKAVRIEGDASSDNLKAVIYLVLHDGDDGQDAYYLSYLANEKDYERFLPEFEEMVKSFRFEN